MALYNAHDQRLVCQYPLRSSPRAAWYRADGQGHCPDWAACSTSPNLRAWTPRERSRFCLLVTCHHHVCMCRDAAGTETLRTKSKENTLKRTGKYLQSRVPILQDRLPKRSRCLRILCRVITGPANAEEASSDSLELNELKDPTERWVNFHLISRAAEHQALRISWRALLCAIPSYHTITKQSSVAPHAFANRQAHL